MIMGQKPIYVAPRTLMPKFAVSNSPGLLIARVVGSPEITICDAS